MKVDQDPIPKGQQQETQRSACSNRGTVRATKIFLDEKINSLDFEDFNSQSRLTILFANKRNFERAKQYEGIGERAILKFLGDPWSSWAVKEVLSMSSKSTTGRR